MAHHTVKPSYHKLVERLNRFPQGAPPSKILYQILQMLFSEQEAEYVSALPIKPFKPSVAARIWKKPELEARKTLDELSQRGILLDVERNGEAQYILPPPMAGFFEFSLMRVRKDLDQKLLFELLYQYLNVEEDFARHLFGTPTQMGRAFVNERALPKDAQLHVLDYERASEVIKKARSIAVGLCYCRHKKQHLGKACNAPLDVCMTFNTTARSLIKHRIAREVDSNECLDILQKAYDLNLVQFGENVRKSVAFLCNCCGCCCEALEGARKFGFLNAVQTTNYLPKFNLEECIGCGKCTSACGVEALSLISANDPKKKMKKKVRFDREKCLGCGVCVRVCPNKAIILERREQEVLVPLNAVHRTVLTALERGQLQNLVFDNHALWNHRLMGAILGVILRLPPIKQVLATRQMKSRYLEYLCAKK